MHKSSQVRIPLAAAFAAAIAICQAATASWLPFRIAVADSYEHENTYLQEASDIYGLRIGLWKSINHDVYLFSFSVFSDGGFVPGSSREFEDNDFGGFKIGGLFSSFSGSGVGFQLAGLANVGGDVAGFQIAGVSSDAAFLRGLQIGGLVSLADMEMYGLQIGGIVARIGNGGSAENVGGENLSEVSAGGFQIGGLFAGCDGSFSGVQIGCFTYARELHGVQIGVVNNTDSLHGVQIGAINISGTSSGGDLRFLPAVNLSF